MSEDQVIPVRWGPDEEPVNILVRKEDEKKETKDWLKDHKHPNGEECKCPKDIENISFRVACLNPIKIPRVFAVKFNPNEEWKYLLYREEDEKKSGWDFLHNHVHHDGSPCKCPKLKNGQKVETRELEPDPILSDKRWKGWGLFYDDELFERGVKALDEKSGKKRQKMDKEGKEGKEPSCIVNVEFSKNQYN